MSEFNALPEMFQLDAQNTAAGERLSSLTGLERNIEKQPRDQSRGYLQNVPDGTFELRAALR